MKVQLETQNGGFVVAGELPPYNKNPDVLYWGTRTFAPTSEQKDGRVIYREAFVAVMLHEMEERG